MKEVNTETIDMTLEELFQFALNIEEAAVNPGKDSEGNARSSKETKIETTIPWKQGGGKGKGNQKRSGGNSSILKGQDRPCYDFVTDKAIPNHHVVLRIRHVIC
jgi:hypothetical protein